jgi:sialate O-acetylesterase
MDLTFLDGQEVGSMRKVDDWDDMRVYDIPGEYVKHSAMVLSARIVNTYGEGGFRGKPEQLRIYPKGDPGADPVLLAGKWKYRVSGIFPSIPQLSNPNTPSVLYNGMLHPLTKFAIKGAIWYQGEANVSRAVQYRTIFPGMITDWRKQWNLGDFPFYFVQLAPYKYGTEYSSAELREAQFLTLSSLENTGMAVTLDIGNPENIHPTNKRDVGKRLALWALAKDYGQELVFSGPLYKEIAIEGNTIRVSFDHTGKGLQSVGGPLTHFEIAGEDRIYYPAKAVVDGSTVLVGSPKVPKPVAVRYAWTNKAVPNLSNWEGLPASSFCSDDWPRITE